MIKELNREIEVKRAELNVLFGKYGLNDYTLKKSQELDELIVIAQRQELDKVNQNSVTIGA
ncbi:aspartyl-phosphate phosphatase Spo0E family protein [Romboutsia sp.]|uniref:aspartyl-phosphate phosphatase Spo0E family protein n=1 Tax=Romboutsia sp. TaxID=1965302 RepID=UPI002B5774F2|nr:aspartyl-phosphate phosphatase Spo0E family protein [Romboutsia sp.]HSQ87998.1 aspartyl-phosphate phosphatase Spo0E family protein [Romboutsia sp.]